MNCNHEKQLRELKNLYQVGNEMCKSGRSQKLRAELAKRRRLSYDMLALARQFATQYTRADLAELIGLRKPDGSPLSTEYLPWLLMLPWRTKSCRHSRRNYQRQFAELGWTARKVRNWIVFMASDC
jgi:hypothetical protein